MGAHIEDIRANYKFAKIKMTTSDDRTFFMSIEDGLIKFWSDESSSGGLTGKPIVKSTDEIFKWIGVEGDVKEFHDRVGVQPKPKK